MVFKAGLLVLASLVIGPIESPRELRTGIYCRSLNVMDYAVELALQGGRPAKIVESINAVAPNQCFYSSTVTHTEKLTFVKAIPDRPRYGIFETKVDWFAQWMLLASGKPVWMPTPVNDDFYTVQLLEKRTGGL